jgi:hypothetical protein
MASTAAELAELWGGDGSDSDEDKAGGGAGAADDIALARHSFEVSQQRMRTLGYQEVSGALASKSTTALQTAPNPPDNATHPLAHSPWLAAV